MENKQLREEILSITKQSNEEMAGGSWWHSIELGEGVVTKGVHPLEELQENFALFQLPDDLSGRTLLDIGCWDGFYSFEAEQRGAKVMSSDRWTPENYFKAKAARNSQNEFRQMTVYDISKERLGSYDIVLFLGVLYHLRHPLLALERVCEVTKDIAIIESHVIDRIVDSSLPIMEFYEFDQLGGQYDNWWGPNVECLAQMVRSAGFVRVEVLRHAPTRVTLKAYKRWADFPQTQSATMRIVEAQNALTLDQTYPNFGEAAFVGLLLEGLPANAPRWEVKLEIGGFGSYPVYLGPSGDPAKKHLTQINAPIPPGLDAGTHVPVRVAYEGKCSNVFEIELAPGAMW